MLVLKQGSIFFALIQLEEYPSLVEGTGLENREVEKSAQGFESLFLRHFNNIAGQSSLVARWAHNPKVTGSNPVPATNGPVVQWFITFACHAKDREFEPRRDRHYGFIAQLAEHKTENLGVVGSIPTEATILNNNSREDAPIAQLDRAFDYGSKGWGFDSSWAHQNRKVAQLGRAFGLGPRGCRFKSCLSDH